MEQTIKLVKHFEPLHTHATRTKEGWWIIGYGHTMTAAPDKVVDEAKADELLHYDLRKFEEMVLRQVTVPLSDNQLAALTSFTMCVGIAAFEGSTLLRLLNRGWYMQVPTQLMRWNKYNGMVSQEMTRRRQAEADLFRA